MPKDWADFLIIAFIVGGIALAVWKGGQANPQSTGSLSKEFSRLQGEVRGVKRDVVAIDGKVGMIEGQVADLERRSAKGSDIERLERQMAEHGQRQTEAMMQMGQMAELLAATKEAGDQRGKQLDRLYDFIVERGMSK